MCVLDSWETGEQMLFGNEELAAKDIPPWWDHDVLLGDGQRCLWYFQQ